MKGKIALLLVLALCISGFYVAHAETPAVEKNPSMAESVGSTVLEPTDGMQTVCVSDSYELRVNAENGTFALADRRTGEIWSSVPAKENDDIASGVYRMEVRSNLIVYGLEHTETATVEFKRNSETASVRKDGVTVAVSDTGFVATYTFPKEGWTIPLRVELKEDHLAVSVVTDQIVESTPETYQIQSISLLPYFGAAGLTEEGYILLPDGSGSVLEFNNGKYLSEEYIVPFYGRDSATNLQIVYTEEQRINLPVWGFSKEAGGMLAVVSGGAEVGTLYAQTNRRTSEWASAHCQFQLRPSDIFVLDADSGLPQKITLYYDDAFQTEKCEVLFYPLDAEEKDYSGMARKLRQYLTQVVGVKPHATGSGVHIDLYGAVKKQQSILGIPFKVNKTLTTVNSARAMLSTLNDSGVDSVRMRYLSWSKDGLNRKVEKGLSPVSGLGSVKSLLALQQQLAAQNGQLYMGAEVQQFYKGGNGVSTFTGMSRSLSNAPAYQYHFTLSTGIRENRSERGFLLSLAKTVSVTERVFRQAEKRGFTGLSLGSMAEELYTDFSSSVMAIRSSSLKTVRQALSEKPATLQLLADSPNEYLLPWVDAVTNLSGESSLYDMTDRSVPFVQIVYSGLLDYSLTPINLRADPKAAFLNAIETGAGLHYSLLTGDNRTVIDTDLNYLTSVTADRWMDMIIEQSRQAASLQERVKGAAIHHHSMLTPEVSCTVYDNGVAVYVNSGDADWHGDGITVPSGSFLVGQEAMA